jgi:hypothetical protein
MTPTTGPGGPYPLPRRCGLCRSRRCQPATCDEARAKRLEDQ